MSIETIPAYLERMARKDVSKGYEGIPGLRTTGEIADYFGLAPRVARKLLNGLYQRGLITSYDRVTELPGAPYMWGPATPDDDPDGGETLPANDNIIMPVSDAPLPYLIG